MKATVIYFARCIGLDGKPLGAVKVGCSGNAALRAKSVASGQPYTCEVLAAAPGGFLDEALMHEWLRKDRLSGEFFRESAEMDRLISSVRETHRFPLAAEGGVHLVRSLSQSGVQAFMGFHGLTVQDVVALTGRRATFIEAGLSQKTPSRALVAALAVAAIKRGHTVHWVRDFMVLEEAGERAA